jgi:hypothetical protein
VRDATAVTAIVIAIIIIIIIVVVVVVVVVSNVVVVVIGRLVAGCVICTSVTCGVGVVAAPSARLSPSPGACCECCVASVVLRVLCCEWCVTSAVLRVLFCECSF